MIHPLVMVWITCDQRQGNYVNFVNQWYYSIGLMVFTFLFAIPTTLAFEVPFMNIEKSILFPTKNVKAKAEQNMIKSVNSKNGVHYEPISEDNTLDVSLKDKLVK